MSVASSRPSRALEEEALREICERGGRGATSFLLITDERGASTVARCAIEAGVLSAVSSAGGSPSRRASVGELGCRLDRLDQAGTRGSTLWQLTLHTLDLPLRGDTHPIGMNG